MGVVKRQHYIPRMILRRHCVPFFQKHIWLYDKETDSSKMVSLMDVMHKNFLYELYDDSGAILDGSKNLIECNLGRLESKWSFVLSRVSQQAVLSDADIALLYQFMAMQLVRMPDVLQLGLEFVMSQNDGLSCRHADRIFKVASFPISGAFVQSQPALEPIISAFIEMPMFIFNSTRPLLLSGSFPVSRWLNVDAFGHTEGWVFPFSRNQCIVLGNIDFKPQYLWLSNSEVLNFNRGVVYGPGRFVLGSVNPKEFLI